MRQITRRKLLFERILSLKERGVGPILLLSVFDEKHNLFPGGHSGGVPPDPIPNSEVKTACADDSELTARESKSLPGIYS